MDVHTNMSAARIEQSLRSHSISKHQFEYLYKRFRQYIKHSKINRVPNRTEFKGVIVMLGTGPDTSNVEDMLAHLKKEWASVEAMSSSS